MTVTVTTKTAAPKTTGLLGNFWLVKTGGNTGSSAAEVQNLPKGQKPLAANWGGAVYLGSTVNAANSALHAAAEKLKVPDPSKVPTLATSLGILGAIAGGSVIAGAAGAAAVDAATAGETTAAGAAGRCRGGGGCRGRDGGRDEAPGRRFFAKLAGGADHRPHRCVRHTAARGAGRRCAGDHRPVGDREETATLPRMKFAGPITNAFALGQRALAELAEIRRLLELLVEAQRNDG